VGEIRDQHDGQAAAMAEATALTRAGRLAEATALIQRTLAGPDGRGRGAGLESPLERETPATERPSRRCPDGGLRGLRERLGGVVDHLRTTSTSTSPHLSALTPDLSALTPDLSALRNLSALPGLADLPGLARQGAAAPAMPALPGRTDIRTYRGPAGERPYILYVPTRGAGSRPLIVMLHGGTQTAADFAAATRMSALAEEHGFLVAYPEQVRSANVMRYWNWFEPGDQQRGAGEPAILAGIVAEIAAQNAVDPDRVYVVGFSAGAAMAAVLAATYPDVVAAAGVHSGLPHGCAHDLASAFAAMRQGPRVRPVDRTVPVIAFHGDADTTVEPGNATRVVEQFSRGPATGVSTSERGPGRSAAKTVVRSDGAVVAEQWTVHGLGHAWSGGTAGGSYTDPAGPDASAEMVRFFAEHPRHKPR
jgi:poly(hydroxyalkanoate) depolymerase family esterase